MKPEEQRIAIAEACGYKLTPLAQNPSQRTWQYGGATIEIPDYLNDLNAMHEAEKVLVAEANPRIEALYITNLAGITSDKNCEGVTFATAAQRAEAFLRTLNLYTP